MISMTIKSFNTVATHFQCPCSLCVCIYKLLERLLLVKNKDTGSGGLAEIQDRQLTICVTLGKLCCLSVSQFPRV